MGHRILRIACAGPLLALCVAGPAAAAPAWLPPQTLSASPAATAARVAVDPDGDAIAVWLRSDGTNLRVQASRRPAGDVWSPPVDLSPAGEDAATPQVAIAANGDAVAVWATSGNRVQAAARPAEGDWGAPSTLASGGSPADPQVALRSNGDAVAVWARQVSGDTLVQSAARSAGGSWAAPNDVSPTSQNASRPHVGLDAAGDAVAVWIRTDPSDNLVRAATRPAGGSWSAAVTLSTSGTGDASATHVAVDPLGNAIAVWLRPDGDQDAVWAARRPAGGSWGIAETLSDGDEAATAPDVAVDADGDAVAVWSWFDDSDTRIEARARPAAGPWQASTLISANGQNAVTPQVAMTADGEAEAVWSRFDGTRNVVQAARRPPGGSWAAPTTLSAVGQAGVLPEIAFDEVGSATAAWIRSDGTATVQAAGYDSAGPVATAVTVPASGTAGSPVAVAVTFTDVWSALAGAPLWTFGDGASASGASVTHTYAAAGVNTVTVSQSDALGNPGQATRSITVAAAPATPPPAPPTPHPQPVLGKNVVAEPLSGRVLARVPGSTRFAPVDPSRPLPVGTLLDTRRGRVAVTTALTRPGATQTGVFWAGVFQVRQPAKARGRTDIVLRGGPPRCSAAQGYAAAARRRPPRRLWAKDDDGRFTTQGRNSVASVRGTRWLTEERCEGTLTRVVTGAVLVRNVHTGRSVLVKPGRSHLARIPRRGG